MPSSQMKISTPPRAGVIRRPWVIVIALVASCIAIAGAAVSSFRVEDTSEIVTHRPIVGDFAIDIVERGDVESSSNTELRSEIATAEGVRILELLPEGTVVEPGDIVVELDDSTIRKDLNTQRIALNTVEAAYIKAKNEFDAALLARKEYEFGTFLQDEQKLESELFVAEEDLRRAKEVYTYSRRMAGKGYITNTQLEDDRFSVERYVKDLEAAATKLRVLREFTKFKTLKKHDSDIKTAESATKSEEAKFNIERDKLANLESQLTKCVIKAPTKGQVVYHNPNRWQDTEFTIRKGNRVRERQIIVKLPDTGKMQVKAKIGEARVDRIKPGMSAIIRVEAIRGSELEGIVKTVNAFASDENWFNPNTKEYDAVVTVNDPPPTLKPGMTSQVSIRIESQSDVLQVPVQCVVERSGKHYSVVREESGKLVLRELLIGSSNEKYIVIKDGLTLNDDVVMNPRVHLSRLGLKDVGPEPDATKPEEESKKSPATPVAGETTAKGAS